MRKLSVSFYISLLLLVFSVQDGFAQTAPGYALLSGTQTTSAGDSADLNQSPASIKWSNSLVDSSYFTHSTESFSHEVTINSFGDYKLSLTIPLILENTSSNRRQVIADVKVNGVAVPYGRAASSYIRMASEHNESSLHLYLLLESLQVNDKVSIEVAAGSASGKMSTPGAKLILQYVDPGQNIFTASATENTNGTNLNSSTVRELEWSSSIKDSAYTHSDSSSPEDIVLSAGDYIVALNIPLYAQSCAGRLAPRAEVRLDGSVVSGGYASQGYIRCQENHDSSSLHWVGLLRGVTNGQILSVGTRNTTSLSDSVIIASGTEANIFIEQVVASSNYISLTGNSVLSGNNFNSSIGSPIKWNVQSVIDSSIFSHSTSSNSHQITINSSGDYYFTYNDHLSSSSSRPNVKARLLVNGSLYENAQCMSHYIRNGDGHTQSSCSLSYYIQGLEVGDIISVEMLQEAYSGTVNDSTPARLTLQRVGDSTSSNDCTSIVDCTPDRILHYDAQDQNSVLDESNRKANDVSFSGSVATIKDISGSTSVHDGTQNSASLRPSYDSTTMGFIFDGTGDAINIANHADLNLATLKEKSIVLVFRTGSDVTSSQVIYEEGGTVRGMNAYIRNGRLYIAFWNLQNDGDGSQAFTSASTPISADTFYYASLVIDYSNYTGSSGPDGQLRGHINGVEFASLGTTTSLLYPHSGAIAMGAMVNDTYFDTGPQSGSYTHRFQGTIHELIIYNKAISNAEAVDFHAYLSNKWPDPQPPTNLALSQVYTDDNSQTPLFSWTASVSSDVDHYEAALGTTPGDTDVQSYTNVGSGTSAQLTGQSLAQCTDYFISLKAVDGGSDESTSLHTSFLRYDGVDPTDPSGLSLSGSSSATTSKTLNWVSSTDECSLSGYSISIGTSAGATDVVPWTQIGNVTNYTLTALTLSDATDYYFNLKARDEAGNESAVVSSLSWQVDTCVASDVTAPSDPSSLVAIGNAGPTSSPNHTWAASTDACGFSFYQMAIGTTPGGTDIYNWATIGDTLNYKMFSISPTLATNTNYYTSVRGVDLAGNQSGVVTTSAWQLPAPGGVSSGLALWLDASDPGTLYADTGCSSGISTDGSSVGCWQDKSPTGNDLTASGSARPTLQTNEFNAQSVIRFDGSNDALDFNSAITNMRSVFVVNKSNSTSYQQVLGHTSSRHFYTNNSTLLDASISSVNLRSGSWKVDLADVSSPTAFVQTSSYSLLSVVTSGDVEADHIASDRKQSGRFFNGDVVEVIVYNRALSPQERSDVESYIYSKWFSANPPAVSDLVFASAYSTSSSQSPQFNWSHSSAPDLDYYEVALGTSEGSNDIAGWLNVGQVNNYQFLGLSLPQCGEIYASVRAVDTDGYRSSYKSTAVGYYDGQGPSVPTSPITSGTATPTQSKVLNWASSSDACGGSVSYEVALGTSAGADDVESWTSESGTSKQFTAISPDLSGATDYYLSVRARDGAGNLSSAVSATAFQLDSCVSSDVTPPSDPSSLSLSENATVIKTKRLSWSTSTDACSFSHYEVALGTSSGGAQVISWTNVGSSTNYLFGNISNLSYSTNYYLSVKAVDTAGNESSVVSSSAWQLSSPGSVSPSGMSLWLDAFDDYTLYKDQGCASAQVTANNDSVACVYDKSGNDNHAVNSSASNRPKYKSSNFNGRPSLYFNGSVDEYLHFGTLSSIRTVFWVIKEDSSSPGNTAFLLGNSQGASAHFHRDSTLGPIFSSGSASSNVTGGSLNLNTSGVDGTVVGMPTSESVLSLVTTGNVSADSFSQDRVSCCSSRTWGGNLSELIIFDRALNASEVADIENYLMVKWGITATSTQWVGGVSTDWFNGSNWTAGVPDATKSCVIVDRSNDPVINGTGVCRDVQIVSGGLLTLQNATGSSLQVYGNFNNQGSLSLNDGQITMRDDGVSLSAQLISSTSVISKLGFLKTAGGSVSVDGANLQVDSLTLPSGSFFSFVIPGGKTLSLPNGMTMEGGIFNLLGGGTVSVGASQSLVNNGGSFRITGTNDPYDQNLSNKGTITSSGRWGFVSTGGEVALTGFLLDKMDVNGLRIEGSTNLSSFDGGQFTNLLADFSTPVRALILNTSVPISESLASNIGFSWSAANATYSGIATPSDNYYLVHGLNCGGNTLVFDQWFGDFWGTTPEPLVEDKIYDNEDGGNCQISMDISASPVHLLSFVGEGYQDSVLLKWETGAEIDHIGFNIYRSVDGSGFEQINQELIRNFENTTSYKGKYRYLDAGLTNETTYAYMIEDVAINGKTEFHGPIYVVPSGSTEAPTADTDENVIADGSDAGANTDVLGNEGELLADTKNALRIKITPSALSVEDSELASHKALKIPGYGQTQDQGHPELLYRRFLVEVEDSHSSLSVDQISLSYTDKTTELSGQMVGPSPVWSLNGSNQLEATYTKSSSAYSSDDWSPSVAYQVSPQTISISGKHYVQIDLWPLRYKAQSNVLEQVSELVLDIYLEGSSWEIEQPAGESVPEPASLAGNLRLEFNQTGVYEVSFSDLEIAHAVQTFNGVALDELRLYHAGVEIPLEIESADGLFNAGDKLRYYVEYQETLDSNKDEVILSSLDLRKAEDVDLDYDHVLRIETIANGYSNQPIAGSNYYSQSLVLEENNMEVFDTPFGGNIDHIFWQRIFTENGGGFTANSSLSFAADLKGLHIANDEYVKIVVHVRGRGAYESDPTHTMGLYVNGSPTEFDVQAFASNQLAQVTFEVPSYQLLEGANTLEVRAMAQQVEIGDYDLMDINKIEITYPSQFLAQNDRLRLVGRAPNEQISVADFTSNTVKIYDVSHRFETMIYQDFDVSSFNSKYLVQFDAYAGHSGLAGRDFLILLEGDYLTPTKIELTHGAQTLAKTSTGSEYVVITTEGLESTIAELLDYRASQGLSTSSFVVEELYNEFSGGRKSSEAIRSFIQYAQEAWTIKPKYILIVGDATYDPKGQLEPYGLSQMPMPLVQGQQMDFGSDHYFVESDNLAPQLSIGRLPASNRADLKNYIDKLIDFESGSRGPSKGKLSSFIYGSDTLNEGFQDKVMQLEQIITPQNSSLTSKVMNLGDFVDDTAALSGLESHLDQGQLVSTYYGHGAEDVLGASGGIQVDVDGVKKMKNQNLPVVLSMNCLSNNFYQADPTVVSLGEAMVFNPDGGGVAVWGSTSMTSPVSQMNLATAFFNQLAVETGVPENDVRMGDILLQAKVAQGSVEANKDTVRSWVFIGDPALRLPASFFPEKPQPAADIEVTPAPAANNSGGGGCSLFADDGQNHSTPTWIEIATQMMFFIFVFMVWAVLRLVRQFL